MKCRIQKGLFLYVGIVSFGKVSYHTSLVSELAVNEPMNTHKMEMMTQASEKGAKICTNLTPTATIKVKMSRTAVPYTRKLFHGLV